MGLENLINSDTTEGRAPGFLYEGRVSRTVTNDEDRMYFTCPDIGDGLIEHGPAPWVSRGESGLPNLPQKGDLVLAAFTISGEPWIIGWWPYD